MSMRKASHGQRGEGKRGFTLLLAALVASIVLTLGASIFEIAQKEVTLSSLGRDSQFAFYAADTLAECALYWDFRDGYFASSTPNSVNPACDEQALTPFTPTPTQAPPYTYPYTLTSQQVDLFKDTTPDGQGYCAQVSVEKCNGPIAADGTCTPSNPPANPPVIHTLIVANGYNVPCATISTAPQALQRTVELHY